MLKNILTWAFLCITAPFVCSHEISIPDSIEDYISTHFLDEVVVKASSTINKTDGKVIRPNKEIRRGSVCKDIFQSTFFSAVDVRGKHIGATLERASFYHCKSNVDKIHQSRY